MNKDATWFRRGLAARVDALELELKALVDGEADAESTIKHVARSLISPAREYGFPEIEKISGEVEKSRTEDLGKCTSTLAATLRAEAAKAHAPPSIILIAGGQSNFNADLVRLLDGPGREVLLAPTGNQALYLIERRPITLLVLNLALPDMDGQTLLRRLRSIPKTASLCILVLAPKIAPMARDSSLALEANGLIEGRTGPDRVAEWIVSRLRRSHESAREARRDALTGLLNRAAFLESLTETAKTCRESAEPLAIAILSVDHPVNAHDRGAVRHREETVQRIASLLSTSLRSTDVIARWSGDEFAAMFPAEDQFGGACAVQKVLARLHKKNEEDEKSGFGTGLSAGVAVLHGGKSVNDAMNEADRYLLEAKSSGGGRVVYSSSPIVRPARRVLIAHDDDLPLRVIKKLLDKDGFDITHVSDVKEAAAAWETRRFHLILVGETVGGSSGFGLLRDARQAPHNSRVPIVMLLADNSEESMVEALSLGASDYLARPLDPFNFMAHMRRVVTKGPKSLHAAGGGRRILLVDDDAKTLLVAASALHHRGGFRAYLARSLPEAVDRINEARPELLIVADNLASADTPAFDRLLAKTGLEKASVALSSKEGETRNPGDTATPKSLGFAGMIPKPFDPLTLGRKTEDTFGLTANSARADDDAEHLGREMRRITADGTPHPGSQ